MGARLRVSAAIAVYSWLGLNPDAMTLGLLTGMLSAGGSLYLASGWILKHNFAAFDD